MPTSPEPSHIHAPPDSPGPAAFDPLGLAYDDFLPAAKAATGLSAPAATDAYHAIFRRGITDHPRVPVHLGPVATVQPEESPEGEVVKFTQRVAAAGGAGPNPVSTPGAALRVAQFKTLETESVLIPMIGRRGLRNYTLCLSSQVGCAMGCGFCETAQMGLIRHLTPGEIVGQWYTATHVLKHHVRNIVFMGMGEPLDNYDNLITAIGVLIDHHGAAMAVSKITVSTVGRLDGLAKLREQIHKTGWHRLNLAVSLNAPNDEIRSKIMPVNRAMPMADLRRMLADWPIYGGGKLCLEYVLIPGVNDAREHAAELAEFVGPINRAYQQKTGHNTARVMLNLIPYNPRRNSPWPAPREEDVDAFLGWVGEAGIYAKRRRTKGRDLMGACGQLGSASIRGRKPVAAVQDVTTDKAAG